MESFSFNFLKPALIIPVLFGLLSLVFVLLSFLLKRQVDLLNNFLGTPLGRLIRLISVLYFTATTVSLLLTLALLWT